MGRETIDILLPEAEETAILTNMNPEDQKAVQKCIAQSSENFSKHGAILTL